MTTDHFMDRMRHAVQSLETGAGENIFLHFDGQAVLREGEEYVVDLPAEQRPLAGCSIAVKDNINVKGVPTSCGSHILEGFTSPYDATVIEKIRTAGGFIFGKTNLDQFAMGSSNEYSWYGPVKNPVDPERVPGGSSGGSAAAVKAGFVDMALGSETGGSVRQPAAFCGVVGLKPTYGRVSRYGLVAFASSFDQIAPLAGTVADVAMLTGVIAGYDPRDSTSVDLPVPRYLANPMETVADWKIGVPREYFAEGLDPDIRERIRDIISWLEKRGAGIKEVTLPHSDYSIATYYILTTAEASSNLARFDGMRYGLRERKEDLTETYESTRRSGFGSEVKRRIMLGTYVLSAGYYEAYYSKAQKVRRLIKSDFDRVFKNVDALITPTTPTTAFKFGAKTDDPLAMYLSDVYTVSANLSGIPAMSIPVGTDSNNLPIGLQIMGSPFAEETIFQLGHYIEQQYSKTES